MTRISTETLVRDMGAILERVAEGHERIGIRRGNKTVACLVPARDAERLRQLAEVEEEDRRDMEEAIRRLADPNEKPISYAQARRELGLE